MKKIVSVVGIAAAITLSLSATSANAASCPIKIGGLAPLSAPGAVGGGEAMRDATLLAVYWVAKSKSSSPIPKGCPKRLPVLWKS